MDNNKNSEKSKDDQKNASTDESLRNLKINPQEQMKGAKQILIVHGYDQTLYQPVADYLTKSDIKFISFEDKRFASTTFTQRVAFFKDCPFVIVILSPDELVYPKDNDPNVAVLRTHQKIIFELGFWIGKLGRERVFVLYREKKIFRTPMDYQDVKYTVFDDKNGWQKELGSMLQKAGYAID